MKTQIVIRTKPKTSTLLTARCENCGSKKTGIRLGSDGNVGFKEAFCADCGMAYFHIRSANRKL